MPHFCAAINCSNRSSDADKKVSFFRFPKDEERCKRWVVNCRRKDLDGKSSNELNKNFCLCSNHFEETTYYATNIGGKRLILSAIPTIFDFPSPPARVALKRKAPAKRLFVLPMKKMSVEELSDARSSFSRVRKYLEDAIVAQAEVGEKLKNSSQISKNAVSVVKFKAVVDELEAERAAHVQTKAELKQTQDQLELALGEVEVLQKQLARERTQFEKTFLLINKKPACNRVKVSFNSDSESECQVDGSISNIRDPEVNTMHCGVHGSEKRSTACNSVHSKKPNENRSKEDDEQDIFESSEDELKEQKTVFTNRSSAPLRSCTQNSSHKNAIFKTTSAHTTVGSSRTGGHGNLVKTSLAKPGTKLKTNAKKTVKR